MMRRSVASARRMFLLLLLSCAGLVGIAQPELVPDQPNPADEVPKLLQQLRDVDPAVRAKATERLANFAQEPRVLEPLLATVKDPVPTVRAAAVGALRYCWDQKVTAPLLAALDDPDATVRLRAAQAMLNRQQSRATPVLLALLQEQEAEIRRQAVTALAEVREKRAVEPMAALLTDANAGVRQAAAIGLGQLQDARALQPLLAMMKEAKLDMRIQAVHALGTLHELRAVPPLIAEVTNRESPLHDVAATALGWIAESHPQDPAVLAAVEPLIALLAVEKDSDRAAAAEALGRIGDARAVEPLLKLAEDKASWVRMRTYTALAAFDDPRGIEVIMTALKSKDAETRNNAWEGAQRLRPEARDRIFTMLNELLDSKDKETRRFAIERLAYLYDVRGIEPLIHALKDEDPGIREQAVRSLASQRDERAITPLLAALQDTNEQVRTAVLDTLQQYRDPRITTLGLTLLAEKEPQARLQGARLLGNSNSRTVRARLVAMLADPNTDVRAAAIQSLQRYLYREGAVSTPRLLEEMRPYLHGQDAQLRAFAVQLLGRSYDARALPVLLGLARDAEPTVRTNTLQALGALGVLTDADRARVAEVLLTALQDTDPALRKTAAQYLASYPGNPKVTAALAAAVQQTETRLPALNGLITLKDPRAVEEAIAVLKDEALLPQVSYWSLRPPKHPRVTEAMLALLRHPDLKVRRAAVEMLGYCDDARVVPALVALVKEGSAAVDIDALTQSRQPRNANYYEYWPSGGDTDLLGPALSALQNIGAPAVEPLLPLLQQGPLHTRLLAGAALLRMKDARLVPVLIAALHDNELPMRQFAARGLGVLEDVRALAALRAALRDPDPVVRGFAARALGQFGDVRAVEPLLAFLPEASADEQFMAAHALGALQDARAVPALLALLHDTPDEGVRQQAAWALGEIRDPRAVEPLLALLGTAKGVLATVVVEALGKLHDPRALEPLLALEQTLPRTKNMGYGEGRFGWGLRRSAHWPPEGEVPRTTVLAALARFTDPRVTEVMIKAVQDGFLYTLDNDNVKIPVDPRLLDALIDGLGENAEYGYAYSATQVLVKIGAPAVPPLLPMLQSDDISARWNAGMALKRIFAKGVPADATVRETLYTAVRAEEGNRYDLAVALGLTGDPHAVDYIREQLRLGSGQATRWLYALGEIKDARAREALVALLTGTDHGCAGGALYVLRFTVIPTQAAAPECAKAIPTLLAMLKDTNVTIRAHAAGCFQFLEVPGKAAALRPLLQDPDADVRRAALFALGSMADPQVEALLITELQTGVLWSRLQAARQLAKYHTPRAADALIAALQDPMFYQTNATEDNPGSVRVAAARALAERGDQRALPALIEATDVGYLSGRTAAAVALAKLTGQDFGLDTARWRAWLKAGRD